MLRIFPFFLFTRSVLTLSLRKWYIRTETTTAYSSTTDNVETTPVPLPKKTGTMNYDVVEQLSYIKLILILFLFFLILIMICKIILSVKENIIRKKPKRKNIVNNPHGYFEDF